MGRATGQRVRSTGRNRWRRRETKRRRWLSCVACTALAVASAPQAAAQESDTTRVIVAALQHASGSIPEGRVVFDPRLVCTAGLVGWECPSELAERLPELGLELGSREFSHLCMPGARGCRLVGTDVLLELSDPRIFGRSASITLDVHWRTGDPNRPVGRRRSHLHLQRDDERVWHVTAEEVRVLPAPEH